MEVSIENLDEEKKIILREFRESVQDVLRPKDDDYFLLRWLRARDFDKRKAEIMLRQFYKFVRKAGIEDILQHYQLPEVLKRFNHTAFLGFDKEGSPVRFYSLGTRDIKGFMRSLTYCDIVKFVAYLLEWDFTELAKHNEKTGKRVEKSTYITDLEGFSLKQFSDREVIRTLIQLSLMYQNNYPERLKVSFLINVPPVFFWFFNRIKPFIDKVILSKLRIYGKDGWKEDILKLVPAEIIPAYLGGSRYEPKGDPKCSGLISFETTIPSHYYLKDGISSQADPDMKQTVIPKRSTFEIEMSIQKPGSILTWEFITKDYNIRFGVLYKSNSESITAKNEGPEELLEVQNVDCHIFPEKGELVCEKAGMYILYFDNTYSWLTAKQLWYTTKVNYPDIEDIEELN